MLNRGPRGYNGFVQAARKRRFWPTALLGLGLFGGSVLGSSAGCLRAESTKLKDQPPPHVRPASVEMVAPRPDSRHLVILEPARRARLAPRNGGQLVALMVAEQDAVKVGDVLAKVAADDSKGGLISAKGSIQRINESIRDNDRELVTARALAAKGVESARAVERLETLQATLRAQKREAKGSLMRARDAVGAGVIEAPFSGIVTKIDTEVGEYLAPSSGAFVIVQLDPVALEVPLTEQEVAMHDAGGLTFEVRIRGRVFPSRLEWIARDADPGSWTFPARLLIDNPEGLLRSGESAEIGVFGPAIEPQTAVPMTAIRWSADVAYVLRLHNKGAGAAEPSEGEQPEPTATVERVEVTVQGDSGKLVAIAGPLAEGDRVVIAGPTRLVDGNAVVVIEEPEPTLASR